MRWWQWLIAALLALIAIVAAALFLFRTPDTDAAAMRAKYGGAPSRFVDLGDGLTLHVRDTGPRDAPALLLIHGSNASLHTWEPWAERLGRRYRIVRLDLPGHGLTGEDPTHDYSTARQVEIVDRLVRALGIDRFAIGGNSMGGGVAWSYALAHPARVNALVLVDSTGQPDPTYAEPPLVMRIARLPVLRDLATMVTPRSWIEQALPSAYGDPAKVDAAAIDLYWELLRYPGNRLATIDRFATPNTPATPETLGRIAVPTLILWGTDDRMIPASSGDWLASHIPGAELVTYPGIGHLPMEEAPDATAREVDRFLSGLEN
ncbi:alpha/beta hydrolase [Sphingomonas sp. S1-29]|uniref:alpha/beta fold hydrolase n=1 Tax=Sphingomonas sp. S1-29 TaxID=2991074 RepID=UPI00224065FD|nr:alpha/beta hydrolase [Sphingomonas sp. S1-29]UZK70689.1 alpha/beta hydrolase [Sphingomonas sp. S1-29]